MKERISFSEVAQEPFSHLFGIGTYLKKSGLEPKLKELIAYRVSQINGCAFCLDMHHKDAIHQGETEQRLHSLPAWQECPYYTDAERAVLAFIDSLTLHTNVDDETFETLSRFFSHKEIGDLTFAVAGTYLWNMLNKTFRTVPGTYRVGQFG